MAARRTPLLLAFLALLGLMAGALWLALDGASPGALLGDGGDDAAVPAAGGSSSGGEGAGETDRGTRRGHRPGRITGDVRDLRTRDAAAGKVVTLTLADGDIRQIATDAAGSFAFGDVPPDQPHELRVDGDDHVAVVRPGLFLRPGERLDVGTLWLADGVRVAFEVRSFDGRPLGGATVRAFTQGPGSARFDTPRDPTPVALAHTGADGVAHFEGLPPGTWTFTAERGGYARRGLVGATIRQGVPEERFRLALERGYRLDGRVLDAVGRPVSGAPVLAIRRTLVSDATTAPLALRTTTDRDGRFAFAALPAADVVLWSGWPNGRLAVLAAVRLPGVESLDLVLLRGGRLGGTVTRADDGAPVADAQVNVTLQVLGSFSLAFRVDTDHEGRYVIDLPMPGTVTGISAELRGYRTEWAELDDGIAVPTGALVGFDLALQRGGVISGRVIGPDGPLAGAEVGATNSGWYFSTTTDRVGRFVINGLPRERFFVLATLWGHVMPDLPENADHALASGTAPAQYVADLQAMEEAEIEIALQPGVTLQGRVESHDGTPAAGAVVTTAVGGVATHTGDDGAFSLGPLERGEVQIGATAADGGARGSVTVAVPAPPDVPEAVVVRLGPEMRVTGQLSSAAGLPLEGAYIQVVPWDGSLENPVTDEWSWLEATRLPVAADGTFSHAVDGGMGAFVVRAGALGHRRARSGRVAVAEGQPEVYVELALEAGETFSGRVVNLDGAPVPRAYVAAVAVPPGTDPYGVGYPGAWGPPIVAVADEHGVFRVDGLDTGPHAIRVWAEGHLPDARVVDVPEDSSATFEIVAALSIEGRATYGDGAAVVRARVVAVSEEGGAISEGRTGEDGRFRVPGLAVGTYRLEVMPSSDGRQNMISTMVEGIAAGTQDVSVSVERGQTITGVVIDSDGGPLSGANVTAMRTDTEDTHAERVTDGNGAFELSGLPRGRVRITVQADSLQSVGSAVLEVATGTTGVEIRIPRPAEISGVLVGPDGNGIASRQLQLLPQGTPPRNGIWPFWRDVTTDADGSFRLAVAPVAEYRVILSEHPSLTLARDATLRAGDSGVRLVALAGESVSGRLLDKDGNGVGGVEIRVTRENTTRMTTSADDGTFAVSGLQARESYSVWINSQSWSAAESPTIETPASGVSLVLAKLGHTAGRVVDADGRGLGGVSLELTAENGSSWMTMTQDDGSFAMSRMPEGEFRATVDRDDGAGFVDCGTVRSGVIGLEIRCPAR